MKIFVGLLVAAQLASCVPSLQARHGPGEEEEGGEGAAPAPAPAPAPAAAPAPAEAAPAPAAAGGATGAAAPAGCKPIKGDANFPTEAQWKEELPMAEPLADEGNQKNPDYRVTAESAEDVQKAVKFAAKHNIRLTVITSGHEWSQRCVPSRVSQVRADRFR